MQHYSAWIFARCDPDLAALPAQIGAHCMRARPVGAPTAGSIEFVSLCGQPMSGGHMPTKRLAAPPAFQTNNVIAPDRLPYRNSGCPWAGRFRFGFTETAERLMNGRNQSGDLVSHDLISTKICGHNSRGEFPIGRYARLVVWHPYSPRVAKIACGPSASFHILSIETRLTSSQPPSYRRA